MAAAPPERYEDSEDIIREFERGIQRHYVSFPQLVEADWRRASTERDGPAFRHLYLDLLNVFEAAHGTIENRFSAPDIRCYVARTSPVLHRRKKWLTKNRASQNVSTPGESTSPALPEPGSPGGHLESNDQPLSVQSEVPERARRPDFHFVYDLASVPLGGELLTRIEMLAVDATLLLRGRKLADCLDQLFSKTTDVLGIIQRVAADSEDQLGVRRRTAVPDVASKAPGTNSSTPSTVGERLVIISRDLDVIELKYLITDARLKYFAGAGLSMLGIGLLVILSATLTKQVPTFAELGRSFALVVVFGAVGSLLSVIQRMNADSLDVRYDLGALYTRLLGGFRPLIGAFAGVLVWLLVQARVLANTTGSDFFLAAIALSLGVLERSLGDVVTESGIVSRLAPRRNQRAVAPRDSGGRSGEVPRS